MIYWCDNCKIPLVNNNVCTICNSNLNELCNDIRPIFFFEKKLISEILNKNIMDSSVWNTGSIHYLIDGKKVDINYVEYYRDKNKLNNIYKKYSEFIKDQDFNIDQTILLKNDKFLKAFVIANKSYLRSIEYEAQCYINNIVDCSNKDIFIPTVSFSGGKDSTTVSMLVREALNNQKILHIVGDTTLEFPSTYEYIKRFRNENSYVPFMISKSDKNFFDLCKNEFGPPSRKERWCCTIFKAAPIGDIISNFSNEMKSISFVGIRASESKDRKKYERTQDKSKISRQLVAMPILNWNDIDVWLYILSKGIDFNAAYDMGFCRVGCWCCPNNSFRSSFFLYMNYNNLYKKWNEILIDYAKKAGINDYTVYVEDGYWKARRGLRGFEKKDLSLKISNCNLYNDSKIFFLNKVPNKILIELFKPFGEIIDKYEDNKMKIYNIRYNDLNFNIEIEYNNKILRIIPIKVKDKLLFYKRLECQIRKFEYCICCGVCDNICPKNAINTKCGYNIDETKCNHCLKCIAKFTGGCLRIEKLKSKI